MTSALLLFRTLGTRFPKWCRSLGRNKNATEAWFLELSLYLPHGAKVTLVAKGLPNVGDCNSSLKYIDTILYIWPVVLPLKSYQDQFFIAPWPQWKEQISTMGLNPVGYLCHPNHLITCNNVPRIRYRFSKYDELSLHPACSARLKSQPGDASDRKESQTRNYSFAVVSKKFLRFYSHQIIPSR